MSLTDILNNCDVKRVQKEFIDPELNKINDEMVKITPKRKRSSKRRNEVKIMEDEF